jgi:type IV pilus assembly protein PilM
MFPFSETILMAVQPGVWGIDIGQCGLKAIRLQIVDGKVAATAFDYVEHPKILSQPDADPDQLTREALEKFLSRNQIKGEKIAIGVPGQSGLARFVKLPPVEEKKINDIVQFEAKQQIPFPLEEVVWDYQKVSEGIVEGGFAIDTEIGLFAMKRDMINRYLNHFVGVGVEVQVIQMSPLALCNYVTYDLLKRGGPDAPEAEAGAAPVGKKKCVVALDVGTDGSNLIITDGGKIIWQRPIPIGGNHFTRALTKELKLTFAKAEHLKRNAAKSPELANILKALKPVLTDFVGEVQRSLGYFTNTHRDAQVDFMVGLGSAFKLPGLQKYLGDKLQLRIEKPAKFNRLTGEVVTNAPVFVEQLLTFPIAFGLALQALGAARLGTNLLPPEISWDRKIKAKKPWAAAAAAMLLIGTGVWAIGAADPYDKVNDPRREAALKNADQTKQEVGNVDSQITKEQAKVTEGLQSNEAILAGRAERENWLRIEEYINRCLPVPGPDGNMKSPEQRALWDFDEGKQNGIRAAQKYFARIKEGIDPKIAFADDDLRESLAAVDIDSVHSRFTTNLKGLYDNAYDYTRRYVSPDPSDIFATMDEPDRSKRPEGAGWVFEIRGTTWYDHNTTQGKDFIVKTLLANLKREAKNPAAKELQGKISHIFLYNVWPDRDPRPDTYHFVYASLIDNLMPPPLVEGGTDGTTPGPEVPMLPGREGNTGGIPQSNNWVPLSRGSAQGVGQGGPVGPGPGGPDERPAPGGQGGGAANPFQQVRAPDKGGDVGPIGPKGTDGGKDPVKPKTKSRPRFEFVILFVWKENTPSDAYITKVANPPQIIGGGQQGGPGGPGPMFGGNMGPGPMFPGRPGS